MSIVIELAPEEEARLRARAARQGQDAAAYAASVLRRDISDAVPAPEGETLADFLEGYIGVVDSRELNGGKRSHAAQNSEAEFGRIMDEKQRQGHV